MNTPGVASPLDPGVNARRTSDLTGLTEDEAAARLAAGKGNADPSRQVKSRDVIRRNVLTSFNVVLAALIAALLIVGELRDGLFVGAVVAANVIIATAQELVAMSRLQRLQAITAPLATVIRDATERDIEAAAVVQDDLIVLRAGGQVVADGMIVRGAVELDESMLTGESSGVRKDAADEVRSGSFCTAGECIYRAERVGGEAYALRLTSQARGQVRLHTPLMDQFNRLLRVLLTATALLAAALFIQFNVQDRGFAESLKATTATVTTVVPVGMLLGITVVIAVGALRVSRSGAIVQDMYAVEALNYVDVIAFDKTGTITSNALRLDDVLWAGPGESGESHWLRSFAMASAGESKTVRAIAEGLPAGTDTPLPPAPSGRVPFSSARRWSALEWEHDGGRRAYVLGAPETVLAAAADDRGLRVQYDETTHRGLRGVVFARADALPDTDAARLAAVTPLALVVLADEVRHDVHEAFALMDRLAIEPKVISGDHPETVTSLLRQLHIVPAGGTAAGTDLEQLSDADLGVAVERTTVFGRVDPPLKARIIEALKARDHFVAMVGDGANDVPALRAADVGVAMASGTQMARGVAGIVLLRDSFTGLIRGTREATFVLGNAQRLSKLFLAKSVYAFLLILATNMLGLDFPFLPRQGGVTSALTLGIPAVFIAVGVPPRYSTNQFATDVLRFAFPAGLALAGSTIVLQFIVEGLLGRSIEEARTLVSLTIVIVGLGYVLEVLGLEDVNRRRPTRPILTAALVVVLLGVLVTVVTQPALRNFFAFTPVSTVGWAAAIVASAAALLAQYYLTRHWQRTLDILTARPSIEERPRGKARSTAA